MCAESQSRLQHTNRAKKTQTEEGLGDGLDLVELGSGKVGHEYDKISYMKLLKN